MTCSYWTARATLNGVLRCEHPSRSRHRLADSSVRQPKCVETNSYRCLFTVDRATTVFRIGTNDIKRLEPRPKQKGPLISQRPFAIMRLDLPFGRARVSRAPTMR